MLLITLLLSVEVVRRGHSVVLVQGTGRGAGGQIGAGVDGIEVSMVVVCPAVVVAVAATAVVVAVAVGMRHLGLGLECMQLLELRRWTGTPACRGHGRETVLVHLEGQHLVCGRGSGVG